MSTEKKKGAAITGGRGAGFAALEALRAQLPSRPLEEKVAPPPPVKKPPARAVVRFERKGHGGKQVTWIEKLELAAPELETWCRELKQTLGCGGTVDGDAIVLQGDLRARLPAALTARGITKITVSG